MTTIKVYGRIRSNSFSGNYTPCARRAKASVYMMFSFTAPRLSSRLLHLYAETKLHSESMKFIEV